MVAKKYRKFSAGEIRRSQYVYNFGPGAVVNINIQGISTSVCMGDTKSWEYERTARDKKYQQVTDERILKELKENYSGFEKINHFRLPPIDKENEIRSCLVGAAFPSWVLCPKCRNLYNLANREQSQNCHTEDRTFKKYCNNCSRQLKKEYCVPTRFVVSCQNGHLDSFDYGFWLNTYGKGPEGEKIDQACPHNNLKLTQSKGGLSIMDLIISCSDCKGWAGLGEIFSHRFKCNGKKPWKTFDSEYPESEECDQKAKVFQRNSRALWQRINISALNIPPLDYEFPKKMGAEEFEQFKKIRPEDRENLLKLLFNQIKEKWKENHNEEIPYTEESLFKKIQDEINKVENLSSDIFFDEYEVLTSKNIQKIDEFEKVFRPIPTGYKNISGIIEIQKLKVVDALIGFSRNNGEPIFYNDSSVNFLPAVEIFGEGIFLDFDQKFIDKYLKQPKLEDEFNLFKSLSNKDFALEPSDKRKILIHSISHALLKATAKVSGYSLTSIKERLYVSEKMSGILIYTSSSDAEGTLGGLSRLAETKRMEKILIEAEKISKICSNDPLCEEGLFSLDNERNGSVCHSCFLVPETSCDERNEFLSRGLLANFWEKLKE